MLKIKGKYNNKRKVGTKKDLLDVILVRMGWSKGITKK